MYKIVCTSGNVELATTKANGTRIEGYFFDNLSDAWEFLQSFQLGVNFVHEAKDFVRYKVEELKIPGHLEVLVEFTLECPDNRVYKFILSKEDEFDE